MATFSFVLRPDTVRALLAFVSDDVTRPNLRGFWVGNVHECAQVSGFRLTATDGSKLITFPLSPEPAEMFSDILIPAELVSRALKIAGRGRKGLDMAFSINAGRVTISVGLDTFSGPVSDNTAPDFRTLLKNLVSVQPGACANFDIAKLFAFDAVAKLNSSGDSEKGGCPAKVTFAAGLDPIRVQFPLYDLAMGLLMPMRK